MADFSTGGTLITTKGELAPLEIIHLQVEQLYRSSLPFSVHAQIHVPIVCCVIMTDAQPVRGEKKLGKVGGG